MVACGGGNSGAPNIILVGFATGAQARANWDSRLPASLAPAATDRANRPTLPGRCGAQTSAVTRALTENSVGTPRAAILAVNEQQAFEVQLMAVRPDWPYQIPRNQTELMDWFIKQNSGSFWR